MKVKVAGLSYQLDQHTSTRFLVLTIKKGKTTKRRKPYSVHLPANSALALEVASLAEGKSGLLFAYNESYNKDRNLIRDALKAISPSLGILSVRRGGLQFMAQQGMSTQCMLHHSRHADVQMLNRYLAWGALNFQAARERFGIGQENTQSAQKTTSANGLCM